jgi:hypothetical protein
LAIDGINLTANTTWKSPKFLSIVSSDFASAYLKFLTAQLEI